MRKNTPRQSNTDRKRVNQQIRAKEVQVIDSDGSNIGTMPTSEALKRATEQDLDLIELAPNAKPPVVRIMDYGKYQYEQKKKAKEAKRGSKPTETKNIQVKIGTGEHDLALKAKQASAWLREGHRVKVELYLVGRSKYMNKDFHKERLDRVLNLITEEYKIAQELKKGPKGLMVIIEKAK